MNCAFYDKSMGFGTNVEHSNILLVKKYLDIGPSQIWPWKALAAIFQDGRRKPIFSYLNNYVTQISRFGI